MTKKKAKEGFHYTLNQDGSFNIKRGGRYINEKGVLYIYTAKKAETKIESKENEIQK